MKESLIILKDKKIIEEDTYNFLDEARLLRNRISHRYKEPSREQLIEFVNKNLNIFDKVLNIGKSFLI